MRTLASAVCLGALLCLALPAEATVYKWVDENGVAHYTLDRDEIPRRFRERLRPAEGRTQPLPTLAPSEGPEAGLETAPAADSTAPAEGAEASPDPVTPHAPSASPAPGVDASLSLSQQIARDREAIKQLISSDKATGIDVANDPALREIAERLPRLQSEYEELQREPPE